MTNTNKFAFLIALSGFATTTAALESPDCARLEPWATRFADAESVTLAPKVVIPGPLADGVAMPLFGQPVTTWSPTDFNAVRRMLNECRRAALKRRDRQAGDHLYQAMRGVAEASRPLRQAQQFRQLSGMSVDNMVNYHQGPELAQVLLLGQRALDGEDVRAELRQLSIGRGFSDHMRRLQNAHDYLPADEVAALQARLDVARETAVQVQADIAAEFEQVKQELASVPISEAGLSQLQQLGQHPVLGKVSQQESMAFQSEVMHKRQFIAQSMRNQRAHEEAVRAAKPVPMQSRLKYLFSGDDVEQVSIRGVRPGIPYVSAKRRMKSDWAFGTGAGGDILMKQYAPIRRDMERYKADERRDGGIFEFETMGPDVGQVQFIEHYTGPLDVGAVRGWLVRRYGDPEREQREPAGVTMNWTNDGTHLTVQAVNHPVLQWRSSREFRSALAVTISTDEYTEFVAAAQERCRALRNKPVRDLTTEDKIQLLQGCR